MGSRLFPFISIHVASTGSLSNRKLPVVHLTATRVNNKSFLQPHLWQNELTVVFLHKQSEEIHELLVSHLTGQEPEEEVALNNGRDEKRKQHPSIIHHPSKTIQRDCAATSVPITRPAPNTLNRLLLLNSFLFPFWILSLFSFPLFFPCWFYHRSLSPWGSALAWKSCQGWGHVSLWRSQTRWPDQCFPCWACRRKKRSRYTKDKI